MQSVKSVLWCFHQVTLGYKNPSFSSNSSLSLSHAQLSALRFFKQVLSNPKHSFVFLPLILYYMYDLFSTFELDLTKVQTHLPSTNFSTHHFS